MEIGLAALKDTEQVKLFFSRYLSSENDALYSEEFFCSDGVMASIKRGQMIIAFEDNNTAGAVRFYQKNRCTKYLCTSLQLIATFEGRLF
jgi:hypothetical protein